MRREFSDTDLVASRLRHEGETCARDCAVDASAPHAALLAPCVKPAPDRVSNEGCGVKSQTLISTHRNSNNKGATCAQGNVVDALAPLAALLVPSFSGPQVEGAAHDGANQFLQSALPHDDVKVILQTIKAEVLAGKRAATFDLVIDVDRHAPAEHRLQPRTRSEPASPPASTGVGHRTSQLPRIRRYAAKRCRRQ